MAKQQSKSLFRRILRKFIRVFIILFILSNVYLILCKWVMPPITLTQFFNVFGYGLKRDYVGWNELSPNIKFAAMASEDQLFPDHDGFDWKALEKSLSANPKKKNKIRGTGASTITQQTAKNVFLWQGNGILRYARKIPEFYYTKMIEWVWGKQRILEIYLNTIEMGTGIFGAEAASQAYFHKPAKNLSRAEAAMIIACLPNPKKYTVQPVSKFVKWKQQWILKQMNNLGDDGDIMALTK